jgi:hypothetical protein
VAIVNKQVEGNSWPNFFIVGAARSGTTSLYEILRKIDGIYMSPFKEPEYFAPNSPTNQCGRYYSHEENYLRLFEKAGAAIALGEASTAYLWDPDAPTTIHKQLPNAKIIAILRNPIQRAYSDYLQDRHLRNIKRPFVEVLRQELMDKAKNNGKIGIDDFSYIRNGLYSGNLGAYFALFGRRNVKVIYFEDFTKDSRTAVNALLEFLGVPHRIYDELVEKHNGTTIPRSTIIPSLVHTSGLVSIYHHLPYSLQSLIAKLYKSIEQNLFFKKGSEGRSEMDPEARALLQRTFEPDVRKLEELLGNKVPWKDFAEQIR